MNPAIFVGEKPQSDAAKALRDAETPGACEKQVRDSHAEIHEVEDAYRLFPLQVYDLGAQVNQHLGDVDLDGANFVTGAAKR